MENMENKTEIEVLDVIENNSDMKWYAIYCPSNQEKSTKQNIERELKSRSLENWVESIEVPVETIIVKSKGKNIKREKVLIPCYIFVKANISNGEVINTLRFSKGVLGFINPSDGKSSQRPEPLKDSEVMKFLRKGDDIIDNSIKFYSGDNVKIIDGAFSSFVGVIDSVDNNKKVVKVIVKIFSRDTPVDLEFTQIEKI